MGSQGCSEEPPAGVPSRNSGSPLMRGEPPRVTRGSPRGRHFRTRDATAVTVKVQQLLHKHDARP